MTDNNELLNKDELVKSLQDLDFSQEEIASIIEKGEKEGKFEVKEKEDDEKTIDEEVAEKAPEDKEDMKKAYNEIMSAKSSLEKAMESFLNKFGSVPGLTTPTDFVKKSEEVEIEKSEVNDFEKAFGDKFDTILKGFDNQTKFNEEIQKSMADMKNTVQAIAETPNPLKAFFSNYKSSVIEKGMREDENGKTVINLGNKEAVNEQFAKSIDKIENEQDKQTVRDLISAYNISGYTPAKGLDIVKKALNIDFEK